MPTLQEALAGLKISIEKSNAFGYLPASTETTTTLADTYYPIEGPFTNPVLDDFELDGDSIVYKGLDTRKFKVILSVSAQSDVNTTNCEIGISLNGSVAAGLSSPELLKLTTDIGTWMCQGEIELETDDAVSLVVKSDQAGAKITMLSAQANIFPPTHIIE